MTYKQALQHMKKDLKNIAEYKGTKYGVDYKNNLMVKTEQGTWLIFEPTEAMKLGIWVIPSDQLEIERACSNCVYLVKINCAKLFKEIMVFNGEWIEIRNPKTFSCSLHEYK